VIAKANATITANNASKLFGNTLTFAGTEFTSNGLFSGDSVTSVTLTSPGAVASAVVGTYAITASNAVGTGLGNYNIKYVPGTLAVTLSPSSGASIYVLDATAAGALTMTGGAAINVGGDVEVDSSSSSAIKASGSASVTAAAVLVVGGVSTSGGASVTKTGTPSSTGDPLAGLGVPAYSGTPISEVLNGSVSATITQGVYSQITVWGNAKLTMNPGTYVIEGGGFTVSNSASVSGTGGVMIYNTQNSKGTFGAITMSGNATVNLAPLSSGNYAGILIFQDRNNTQPLTISASATAGMEGTIYASAAQIVESGSAQIGSTSNPVSIVVDTMSLSGSAVIESGKSAAPAVTTAGLPIAPLNAATGAGTVPAPVKGRAVISRAPARFALSPTFQRPSRSLVTTGVKTVSSAASLKAGISVL
jgi:hypothetical protein